MPPSASAEFRETTVGTLPITASSTEIEHLKRQIVAAAGDPAKRATVVRLAIKLRRLDLIPESWSSGPMLGESALTPVLSVTHAPIGKGGKNWITRTKPGNQGQLPAYIQNVRNAIMRGGKDESTATGIAIGTVKRWARGGGNVSKEVRAAAAKAVAEWEALRAKSKARKGVKVAARAAREAEVREDVSVKGYVRRRGGKIVRVKAFSRRGNARALRTVSLRDISAHADTPEIDQMAATGGGKLTRAHMANFGPDGGLRNVERMGATKLKQILGEQPVNAEEETLQRRAQEEVKRRGGLVAAPPGGAGRGRPRIKAGGPARPLPRAPEPPPSGSGRAAPPNFVASEHQDVWDAVLRTLGKKGQLDANGNPKNYAAATSIYKAKLRQKAPNDPWLKGRTVGAKKAAAAPRRAGTGPDKASPLFDHKAALDRLWDDGTSQRARSGILDAFAARSDDELRGMEPGDLADLADAADNHGRSDFAARVDKIRPAVKGAPKAPAKPKKGAKAPPKPKAKSSDEIVGGWSDEDLTKMVNTPRRGKAGALRDAADREYARRGLDKPKVAAKNTPKPKAAAKKAAAKSKVTVSAAGGKSTKVPDYTKADNGRARDWQGDRSFGDREVERLLMPGGQATTATMVGQLPNLQDDEVRAVIRHASYKGLKARSRGALWQHVEDHARMTLDDRDRSDGRGHPYFRGRRAAAAIEHGSYQAQEGKGGDPVREMPTERLTDALEYHRVDRANPPSYVPKADHEKRSDAKVARIGKELDRRKGGGVADLPRAQSYQPQRRQRRVRRAYGRF